jgi:ADP-ribosyl-[dinitrogen reductase] hydrolase
MTTKLDRARGCLLGQLTGDALGSLVEFLTPEEIGRRYPDGVREIAAGGTWDTIAGQPTDDSEMALLLARSIVSQGTYVQAAARKTYEYWLSTKPFDCGMTVMSGVRGQPNEESQANGALMRISPLGIFGADRRGPDLDAWAVQDAVITHPNPVCRNVNVIFVRALSTAVADATPPRELFAAMIRWAQELDVEESVVRALRAAEDGPPKNFLHQQGWVLIAFQNAVHRMLSCSNVEDAVVATIACGGDTDTNAAICGALMGALYGINAIPLQWRHAVLSCRPEVGRSHVRHPRPVDLWPIDADILAEQLLYPTN